MLYLSSWLPSASMFVTEKVTLHGCSRVVKVTERGRNVSASLTAGENKSNRLANYLSSMFHRSSRCVSHSAPIGLLKMHATRHNRATALR